jgi:alpha,alpha-trehalose-phosphate synthase [UDP-forming]/trehalose-phosphatase
VPATSLVPWQSLLAAPRPCLLIALDGVLVPFAQPTQPAQIDADGQRLLVRLRELGVVVAVVSGRSRSELDGVTALIPDVRWFAEHGAWRWDGTGWCGEAKLDADLLALSERLGAVVAPVAGADLERKTTSVSLHWRRVARADRDALFAAADPVIDEWLETHPEHERAYGVEVTEVRPRAEHEAGVVGWLRRHIKGSPIIALCDATSGAEVFPLLGALDIAVVVGPERPRRPGAAGSLPGTAGARRLLGWLIEARAGGGIAGPAPIDPLPPRQRGDSQASLLVVSNRIPAAATGDRQREVGGLVSALEPALKQHGGVWLGWSGRERDAEPVIELDTDASPVRACFDLTPSWRRQYYAGFCNRSLWPLLHGFPGRVRYEDDEWTAYVEANDAFSRLAVGLVHRDAAIWVHDYHLLLVAAGLRHRGHRGPIGLFLHVPFPSRDAVETLPYAHELLGAMLSYDLIGFHTARWAERFRSAVQSTLPVAIDGDRIAHRQRTTQLAVFPIPIDAAPFRDGAATPTAPDVAGLLTMLGDRRLLLGVDRLDYSKGIPERLEAFERLLERYPAWRGRVCFVQISVPSRADVPEYAELRDRVEHLVGRINGRFGEANWVPVRYLYRSYPHDVLAQLYRMADVGVVTPLRDGMNLVAKEFVASQNDDQPGVLVLSRFAGAADELKAAVLTNPYHRDGLADDLHRALSMPPAERRERHRALSLAVLSRSPAIWAAEFLAALGVSKVGALAS